MIKIGNIEASNILIGEIQASKMYIGSSLIWNSQNLPSNCVEIEYLESDGNQWIDTGIFINQTDFEVGYEASGMGSWGWVHQNNAGGVWISLENSSENNKCHWWYGNYNSHGQGNYQEGFYTIKYTLQGIDINSFHQSYQGYLSGHVSEVSLKFFSQYDFRIWEVSTGSRFVTKFKSFYIKKGGTLVADFIPVRVGQIGYMYDKVSRQLFANQGTGNFILGPDK